MSRAVLVGAAMLAACLERNSDFDGPASTSVASTGEAGAGDASTSDTSTTDASCTPDGFEHPGEPSVEAQLGELELVLESIDAIDRYSLYRPSEVPETFYAAADADVRVCVYVNCEDSPDSADVDCQVGLDGSHPDSAAPGCCGGNTVELAFVCGGDTTAKVNIFVDMPPADCTPYTLVLAESAP